MPENQGLPSSPNLPVRPPKWELAAVSQVEIYQTIKWAATDKTSPTAPVEMSVFQSQGCGEGSRSSPPGLVLPAFQSPLPTRKFSVPTPHERGRPPQERHRMETQGLPNPNLCLAWLWKPPGCFSRCAILQSSQGDSCWNPTLQLLPRDGAHSPRGGRDLCLAVRRACLGPKACSIPIPVLTPCAVTGVVGLPPSSGAFQGHRPSTGAPRKG